MMLRLNGTCPLEKYEIASGSTVVSGNLVALNAEGKAVPAADTAGLRVIGVAEHIHNGMAEVADGIFSFANDTTHALTRADRGKDQIFLVPGQALLGRARTLMSPQSIIKV